MKWRIIAVLSIIVSAAAVYSVGRAGEQPDGQPEGVWGAPANGLSCAIRSDKSCYAPGEDIRLDILLRSEANQPLKVIRPRVHFSYCGDALPLHIVGPAGLCSYTGPMIEPPPPPAGNAWHEISRGEITGISAIYHNPVRVVPKYWSVGRPGTYTIRLRFERKNNEYYDAKTRMMIPIAAWEGEAVSNTITIQVAER